MRKWKRATKRFILTMLAAVMLTGTAAEAYAYADETEEIRTESSSESGRNENLSETGSEPDKKSDQNQDSDSTTEEKEVSEGEKIDRSSAFTTLGSAQVKDDIKDGSSKEFLTIVTKNNQTFYLVIDRSTTTDNVYLLSNVDENDLEEFLDEAAGSKDAEEETPAVLLPEITREEEESTAVKEEETEVKEKKGFFANSTGFMLVLLLAVLAGLGGGYYFKIYKPRVQEEDDSENEGLEDDQGYEEIDEG